MNSGVEPASASLSSVRIIGTVGKPINPRGMDVVAAPTSRRARCPVDRRMVADQTRAIMIDRFAGATTARPVGDLCRSGRLRRARRREQQRDHEQQQLSRDHGRGRRCWVGSGAIRTATARPIGRDSLGRYFAGDGAKLDHDGYVWLLGRVDDVMNVSGHRILDDRGRDLRTRLSPGRGRGGRRRRQRCRDQPSDHRLRDHPQRS